MFNERLRNCIKQAKTYPGADMDSDHNPVVVKINMKLKRTNATKGSEKARIEPSQRRSIQKQIQC